MISKVLHTIDKFDMLKDTDNIVIGLSGGADSVSLTHFLYKLSKQKKFNLIAVHVNHCIRKDEAIHDEMFVKRFCDDLGIKLVVKRVDVMELAQKLKLGTEETGRMVRYQVLKEESEKNPNSKIATAHTLSDNIETVVMRLISGTALKGLCGIPAVRGNIIRPLIDVKRREIEEYCIKNQLQYVTDSSNLQRDYTRNKIRLDIIPKFKDINSNFEDNFRRAINSLETDERYLNQKAEEILKRMDLNEIRLLDLALKNRVLLKILHSFTSSRIEQKHLNNLEKIINNGSGKICIPGNKTLLCKDGHIFVDESADKKINEWEYLIKPLNTLTEIKTNIIISTVDMDTYLELSKKSLIYAFDFEKVPSESLFRNRRPKDKFKFPRRNVSKSLKKIFNEFKIPLIQRDKIVVLAYGNEVIWIDGIGVSGNYIPSSKTKSVGIITKENM